METRGIKKRFWNRVLLLYIFTVFKALNGRCVKNLIFTLFDKTCIGQNFSHLAKFSDFRHFSSFDLVYKYVWKFQNF